MMTSRMCLFHVVELRWICPPITKNRICLGRDLSLGLIMPVHLSFQSQEENRLMLLSNKRI